MQSQDQLLQNVLFHCAHFSPYYCKQRWAKKVREGKRVQFPDDLPITPAKTLRQKTEQFFSDREFPADGEISEEFTSGSSGEPMKVRKTDLFRHINVEENVRLQSGWNTTEFSKAMNLRCPDEEHLAGTFGEERHRRNRTGFIFYSLDAQESLNAILEKGVDRLNGYPSLILSILMLAKQNSLTLPIKSISTIGEIVTDELVTLAKQDFDCAILDSYGSVETGIIAATCADCGKYHVADRHIALELLDECGCPVKPGNEGRVVITTLFNSAMPLLRYEIGDLAVLGRSDCPRSRLALDKIIGRERHMFKLPDGRKITPMIPASKAYALGLRQFKLKQTAKNKVEFQYVPADPDSNIETSQLQSLVDTHLDPSLIATPCLVQEIPRSSGGKYLMHESLI